jgi:ribonuclease VapC
VNIESSAWVAILLLEPSEARLLAAIDRDPLRITSAATVFEVSMVLDSRAGAGAVIEFRADLAEMGVTIVPVDALQASAALEAFRAYGKGRHQAGLNFGDCFSYALSKVTGEPLLFVGDDFARTDIAAVAW